MTSVRRGIVSMLSSMSLLYPVPWELYTQAGSDPVVHDAVDPVTRRGPDGTDDVVEEAEDVDRDGEDLTLVVGVVDRVERLGDVVVHGSTLPFRAGSLHRVSRCRPSRGTSRPRNRRSSR